jgi:Protein of unknown function (DUF3455)
MFSTLPSTRTFGEVMNRRIFTSLAATAAVAASILISSGAAEAAPDAPPSLSATNSSAQSSGVTANDQLDPKIQVTAEDKAQIITTLRGVGKQVYDCVGTTWTLREPVAGLFTLRGVPAGIHGKGPFWANLDGSHVDGAPLANVDGGKGNVPWLKIKGSQPPNVLTTGLFSKVTFIQRIDTRGGVAPTGTCSGTATKAVDYTANYVFWG